MNISNKPKRLYRSRQQRVLAGVCGGVAEYFNVDPTWVRIGFILLCLLGLGAFILVYVIFWLIVPNSPIGPSSNEQNFNGG
ncbi:MAG: stress-responsive transcriptional regulator [uncultured bacterium]|nr:MAG: stress-responsive transcriptional regulator [uncultured bacterium]